MLKLKVLLNSFFNSTWREFLCCIFSSILLIVLLWNLSHILEQTQNTCFENLLCSIFVTSITVLLCHIVMLYHWIMSDTRHHSQIMTSFYWIMSDTIPLQSDYDINLLNYVRHQTIIIVRLWHHVTELCLTPDH